ncbi:MAG: T9SS type A sorting domain-containing protein [Dysgonamonadaceae bacterium]|jgi:hypothetical protein|nr:T9SS type A sorting domain-containing protein [Dysgonamonadaceae bacterium]
MPATIAGQTDENTYVNTIVLLNSSWSVLKQGLEHPVPWVFTQYIYFNDDSVVANKANKKVFSCNDQLHENITYEGLIREQEQKTYFIPKNYEPENLLYDFSLEEGTNFEYQSAILYVKKVDSVEINGIQKKRIQLTSPPPDDDTVYATWIEGIGSLAGLFYPQGDRRPPNSIGETLLCYFQDNEPIYKNPAYSECYYDKVEDITSVGSPIINSLFVYPNPVDNVLVISSSNEAISFVELTDVSGKTVYAKRLDANKENKIDVGFFAPGLYLLHAYDAKGLVSTFKIIKR